MVATRAEAEETNTDQPNPIQEKLLLFQYCAEIVANSGFEKRGGAYFPHEGNSNESSRIRTERNYSSSGQTIADQKTWSCLSELKSRQLRAQPPRNSGLLPWRCTKQSPLLR